MTRFLRFRLRTMLILVLVVGGPLGWLARRFHLTRVEQHLASRALEGGGAVIYDYQFDGGSSLNVLNQPTTPAWMRRAFGDAFGARVIALDLHDCRFDDRDMIHLAQLNRLKAVNLGCTKVSDASLYKLRAMGDLETLDLHSTNITDEGLEALADLRTLKSLDLSQTKITDRGLKVLRRLTNLNELRLTRTNVSDAGLRYLADHPSLSAVDLSGTKVTDAGLPYFAANPKLQSINVHHTAVTDVGTQELKNAIPGIIVYGFRFHERNENYERGSWRLSVCKEHNVWRPPATSLRDHWNSLMAEANAYWKLEAQRRKQQANPGVGLKGPGLAGPVPVGSPPLRVNVPVDPFGGPSTTEEQAVEASQSRFPERRRHGAGSNPAPQKRSQEFSDKTLDELIELIEEETPHQHLENAKPAAGFPAETP